MAKHVEDHPAAVLPAIVPRRALRGNRIAFKNPVTEFAPHGENAAKESHVAQPLDLQQARQPELNRRNGQIPPQLQRNRT